MSKIGWEKCAIFDNEWQSKEKKGTEVWAKMAFC